MSSMRVPLAFDANGQVVENDAPTTHDSSSKTYGDANPLPSVAASCHREMVPEYREFARSHGLTGVKWDENGNAVFTDRGKKGRRGWLRATGKRDNDAGYGD
jgi:hypothetical protein